MKKIIGRTMGPSRLLALVLCLMLALGAMPLLPMGTVLAANGAPCDMCDELGCNYCGTPDCVWQVLGSCDYEYPDCVGRLRIKIPPPIVGYAQSDFNVTIIGASEDWHMFELGTGTRWDPENETFQRASYTKIVYIEAIDWTFYDGSDYVIVLVNGSEVEFERYNPTTVIRASIPFDTIGEETFTVTFNANGGTISDNPTYVLDNKSYGTRINPPQNNAVRAGYHFHGWYTTQAAARGTAASFPVRITGNITFYARWETFLPAIDNIVITPGFVTISPGQTHRFEAEVFGGDNPHQGIRWTLDGTTCPGTVIYSGNSGILHAGPTESGTVTVLATSLINENITGTAAAHVQPPGGAVYEGYTGAAPVVAPVVAHEVPQTGITGRMILPIVLGTLGVALVAGAEILRRYKKKNMK
ncbi:MAG: InlB B-repeat-containing protein [Oscillospiraceae bacterium]|nr:InlB B-repeat-containing protein [Oscillospiraceae bacterium]MCL2278931.1 InlB B-repeat-containing protein [Oscillospiraceae bacterium]